MAGEAYFISVMAGGAWFRVVGGSSDCDEWRSFRFLVRSGNWSVQTFSDLGCIADHWLLGLERAGLVLLLVGV